LSPDSSEAKNTALSNDGVKPAFDEEPCVPIQMAAKVALKHGRDPSSNLGRGVSFNFSFMKLAKERFFLKA
jgi:hypothetical protein